MPNMWALVGNWRAPGPLKGVSLGTLLNWVQIVFYRKARRAKTIRIPQSHGVQRTPVYFITL
jgi:hypothetical protein